MVFNEKLNLDCLGCNNKETRENNPNNGLCNVAKSVIDGLPVRCVGDWGKHKIAFLTRYLNIVGNAMKDKWQGLNYIEVCSGPGRCIDRASRLEFDGTPLSVLKTEGVGFFRSILFIDYDPIVVDTLSKRISLATDIKADIKNKVHVMRGDYTKPDELIPEIRRFVSKSS